MFPLAIDVYFTRSRNCGPPENLWRLQETAQDGTQPQETAKNRRGILKFSENYLLKSCVDCGTLQLVLGVFLAGLYLDIGLM